MKATTLSLLLVVTACAGRHEGAAAKSGPATGGDPDAGGDFSELCAGKQGPTGDLTLTLGSDAAARTYLLHVPESYTGAAPAMLVLSFHGFSSDGPQQAAVSGMSGVADERGFLAAYPNGLNHAWNGGTCCPGAAADDVQFARDLVAAISESYCVDPKRIFATGISNGGLFTDRMGCDAADLVAAIAPVAAGIGVSCTPSRPVPVLAFGGSADPFVPFAIQQAQATEWTQLDGCSETSTQVYAQGDATCVEWSECNAGAAVRFCTIDGGGHTWPGGVPIPFGKTSTDIDATREMVTFFEAHPMP
jgi:polyhydroxybutyrate depolymerase